MTTHLLETLPPCVDLIFVLVGGATGYRKLFALKLFQPRLAAKTLFSVSRSKIRRFSKMALPVPLDLVKLASNVPPAQRHFFVLTLRQNTEHRITIWYGKAAERVVKILLLRLVPKRKSIVGAT